MLLILIVSFVFVDKSGMNAGGFSALAAGRENKPRIVTIVRCSIKSIRRFGRGVAEFAR
ncbi:MAG: hypothetical protein IJI03_06260 [Rudaea sp.]|nr:hypothetical protein [Rudaea sp.]